MTILPRDSRSTPIYALKPDNSYHVVLDPLTTTMLTLTNKSSVVNVTLAEGPSDFIHLNIGFVGSGLSSDLSVGVHPILFGDQPEMFKLPFRVDFPKMNPDGAKNGISIYNPHATSVYNVYISEML